MKRFYTFFIILSIFSTCFSQSKELLGKWVLVRSTLVGNINLDLNNPDYSTKLIYFITPKALQFSRYKLPATFTDTQIKTEFRTINYILKDKYLILQDQYDNKISYFLKVDDFVRKNSEFALKPLVRNADSLYVANNLNDYELSDNQDYEELISLNSKEAGRSSKTFTDLYFQIEFVLTKNNKIENIKILHSIDENYDQDYIRALKKSEKFLKNISGKNLLITKEVNHLKWANDLKDKNERQLYDLLDKGFKNYTENNFEKAIEAYSQIENLPIANNRFNSLIKDSQVKLGVSYLVTGMREEACKTFNKIGDKTDFEIRNYLLDFCTQ